MQSSHRVIVNTIVQYGRLLFTAFIGLYTTRLLLNSLGVQDYGIYSLIAGVIVLFGFVKSSLSNTSTRFIAVSLGSSDITKQKKAFNNSFWLHFFIAILLVVVIEFIGIFIFNNFLNIPQDRILAAKFVYHSLILSLAFTILTTPFNAVILAKENILFIAIVNILDSILKLTVAIIVTMTSFDKLIVYGILMGVISIIDFLTYLIYSIIIYRENIFFSLRSIDKKELKIIGNFAGWTVLDSLSVLFSRQGLDIGFNLFFGTSVNSVFGLARQVEGQLYTISSSLVHTMSPQIMKSEGSGNRQRMLRLSLIATKFGFVLVAGVAIPLLFQMPNILKIWLKNVPEGTVLFTRLVVSGMLFNQLTLGLVYANQATGNIKLYSLIVSLIRIATLPIAFLFFYMGYPAYVGLIIFLIFEILGSLSRIIIVHFSSGLMIKDYLRRVILPVIFPIIFLVFSCIGLSYFMRGTWESIVIIAISMLIFYGIYYKLGLLADEKEIVNRFLSTLIKKFNKK